LALRLNLELTNLNLPSQNSAASVDVIANDASHRNSTNDDQDEEMDMEESDDAASADREDEAGSKYPVDGKYISEQDKVELLSMPEIRREEILAKRAEEIEKAQQNKHMAALYQTYLSGDKKRKAAEADLKDGPRKSSRQKTTLGGRKVGETFDAMEAYKKQREQRGAAAEARKADAAERKARRGDSEASDADADGDEEVEWDGGRGRNRTASPKRSEEHPSELHDFNRVHVGRHNFAKVCFYPGMDRALKDCYVRVAIGQDPKTKSPAYRMARIDSFEETMPYAIESESGKHFITTQHVITTIGRNKRSWPLIYCSNTKFTQKELELYTYDNQAGGGSMPKKSFLTRKIDDINNLINRKWTDKELNEKLEKSGVLQSKHNAVERQRLTISRREAEKRGDQDSVASFDVQLKALENPKLAYGTSTGPKPSATGASGSNQKTQQQRLAELNAENRKKDREQVHKALLQEQKANRERRAAIERGEMDTNPHARVKVMATTHFDPAAAEAAKKTREENVKREGITKGSAAARAANKNGITTLAGADEDLELPRPGWGFNYVKYSNDCLGFRQLEHPKYDKDGRRISIWPRVMCDEEVLARIGPNLSIIL